MSACIDQSHAALPSSMSVLARRALQWARQVAPTSHSILIKGDAGTGKKTLALRLHELSPRSTAPCVILHAIDCSPSEISEAMGRAGDGTLVIEQINELPMDAQGRLVKLLSGPRRTRLMATAPTSVANDVVNGRLRDDLYYCISEFSFCIPPLRERIEDILPISVQVLASLAADGSYPVLSGGAIEKLRAYAWPGNVRELVNVVRGAHLNCTTASITAEAIDIDVEDPSSEDEANTTASSITIDGRSAFARQRDQAERAILLAALREGRGTRTDIAQRLGISPRTLRYKLARLRAAGMEVPA